MRSIPSQPERVQLCRNHAVTQIYGDADGRYAFLTQAEPEFSLEVYYMWNHLLGCILQNPRLHL